MAYNKRLRKPTNHRQTTLRNDRWRESGFPATFLEKITAPGEPVVLAGGSDSLREKNKTLELRVAAEMVERNEDQIEEMVRLKRAGLSYRTIARRMVPKVSGDTVMRKTQGTARLAPVRRAQVRACLQNPGKRTHHT